MGDVVPMRGVSAQAEDETVAHVDQTCSSAIGGRRAARMLAEWAKRFGIGEAEFQLLWRLRSAPAEGFDQTALANTLAFSPAQISASVERLRSQGRICSTNAITDRRRHHWQLSASGRELIDQMLLALTLLRSQTDCGAPSESSGCGGREAAA